MTRRKMQFFKFLRKKAMLKDKKKGYAVGKMDNSFSSTSKNPCQVECQIKGKYVEFSFYPYMPNKRGIEIDKSELIGSVKISNKNFNQICEFYL